MLNKIKNLFELTRMSILRLVMFLLFRKKTRPIVLKYLELKINMITESELESWILSDATGL
jgi:hypothetical protein